MIAIAMLLLFQAGIADKPAPQTIAPPIWNVHVMPATIPTAISSRVHRIRGHEKLQYVFHRVA